MRILSCRRRRRCALRRGEGLVILLLQQLVQRLRAHPPPANVARVQLHHFESHPLELPHPHRLHALQLCPVTSEVVVGLVDENSDDVLVDCLGPEPASDN